MQRLNKSITHAVDRPVKVMQFGEGNFLRAFVDYIFDVTNEKTDFNGGVVIVKPIEFGTLERFHDQECQYTLQLRGFVDGQPKEITRQITSVVDAVAAIEDYDKYIEYGTSETLRFIVSNTTEAVSYLTRQITILMLVLLRHILVSLHSFFTRDTRSSTEQQIRDLSYFLANLSLIMVSN